MLLVASLPPRKEFLKVNRFDGRGMSVNPEESGGVIRVNTTPIKDACVYCTTLPVVFHISYGDMMMMMMMSIKKKMICHTFGTRQWS